MSIIHCLTIVLSFARTANLFIEESTSQRVSGTVQKKLKIVWRILPNSETVTFFEEWKLTYPSDNSHYSPFTPPPPPKWHHCYHFWPWKYQKWSWNRIIKWFHFIIIPSFADHPNSWKIKIKTKYCKDQHCDNN